MRSKARPGPGEADAKAPAPAAPPAGVAKRAAKQRYVAPARVDRTPKGGVPAPKAAWRLDPSAKPTVDAAQDAKPEQKPGAGQEAATAQQSAAGVAAPGLGIQGHYGMEEFSVRDGLGLGVNLANGNLVLRATDLRINGPGVGTRWDRFYNGLSGRDGLYGQGWSLAGGTDVGLDVGTNTVVFRGPSGFTAEFTGTSMSPGATWTAPSGMNATLTRRGDSSWRLESHGSGETMDFTAGGGVKWFV